MPDKFDEKTVKVLQSMAFGKIVEDLTFQCHACPYCSYRSTDEKQRHDYECPVVAARELLQEAGMPLSIFQVEYESLVSGTMKRSDQVMACDPEVIRRGYENGYSNIHIQCIREIKPDEI